MKEKTFNDLLKPHQKRFDYYNSQRIFIDKADVLQLLQQVREATKREAVSINDEVILFNMGVDLESDIEFRDVNAEILNLPTDRIKTDK